MFFNYFFLCRYLFCPEVGFIEIHFLYEIRARQGKTKLYFYENSDIVVFQVANLVIYLYALRNPLNVTLDR